MNQYACAITGHRPTRFCFGYNEEDPLCQKLKECLIEQFRILHDEKFVRTFFVGGALGVDMWAGEQLLTLRAQTGYEDIKIIVVIPVSYTHLTGKTKEELAGELQGVIFCVPGQLEKDGTPHYCLLYTSSRRWMNTPCPMSRSPHRICRNTATPMMGCSLLPCLLYTSRCV